MSITVIKVRVDDLQRGMFVSSLDRPWLETPYPIQGFQILSEQDLLALKSYCDYVYVDVLKSEDHSIPGHILGAGGAHDPVSDAMQIRRLTGRTRINYQKSVPREEEMGSARLHYEVLESTYQTLLQDAEGDKQLNLPVLKKAIEPMVQSITRNPDAFIWLAHLKRMDSYTYHHALSCAVWAVAFGRHLGLPVNQLNSLATGCFLFDIGKCRLSKELLNNQRRLSVEEFETVKQHVRIGFEMVKQTKGADRMALEMISTHHERHNGSGYPLGLSEEKIPLCGRIAGIVDAYDAITSQRPFCQPLPAFEAIELLYQWRGIDFQTELAEQFIQVVGIYPVGSLVELSNGSVGVVIGQNDHYRLRPLIMVLLDHDKQLLDEFQELDLQAGLESKGTAPLSIARGLPPGAYDLDPNLYYF
ncbi:HD-GYP domain-containing protein [Sedimenticola hydrogenitrophicus]|uniref:HD-GYP domain-containing protein n=1 Tax=Sedimenticola hydrogenitrophicus TaxID=2967975 RepID=UPI0021A5CDFC|nr:HD-GYP domain-containing protein [Sedimenticola hydrogenitrophicus]